MPIETIKHAANEYTSEYRLICEQDGHVTEPWAPSKFLWFSLGPHWSLAITKAEARRAGWHVEDVHLHPEDLNEVKTVILCPYHAQERSVCNHAPQHALWNAQDGPVRVCKMSDTHLENCIPFIARSNEVRQRRLAQLQEQEGQLRQEYEARLRELVGKINLKRMDSLTYSVIQGQMQKELKARQGTQTRRAYADSLRHRLDAWVEEDLRRHGFGSC